jgi:hypothetical protein
LLPGTERNWATFVLDSVLEVLGWLLVAVMVSFGAPFWYDLTSKLVDARRATGPKPVDATP